MKSVARMPCTVVLVGSARYSSNSCTALWQPAQTASMRSVSPMGLSAASGLALSSRRTRQAPRSPSSRLTNVLRKTKANAVSPSLFLVSTPPGPVSPMRWASRVIKSRATPRKCSGRSGFDATRCSSECPDASRPKSAVAQRRSVEPLEDRSLGLLKCNSCLKESMSDATIASFRQPCKALITRSAAKGKSHSDLDSALSWVTSACERTMAFASSSCGAALSAMLKLDEADGLDVG
mmetsp:Transcript_66984/g.157947  ORF Transcript_66984/g.157947 Transcript_66984/m.157947 type:complete len:236 (-) Transcript_66984:614-1321(-)